MSGKYQTYPEYKDTQVELLGRVPSHWKLSRIKYLCYVNDGNHGEEYPKEADYTDKDNGVPFIRGGNMEGHAIVDDGMLYISKKKNDSMRKGRLETGDILFMNRGEIGKLALISETHAGANLNSQIAYLRSYKSEVVNNYLLYYLASGSVLNLVTSMKMGSVLTQFPIGNLLEIYVPLPSDEEQQKIANFLDHETAKIDTLIKKQQQLIKLLKEKRQAVISHAVTKGLNSNVPMRDSGIEWLGEVPEHWEVSKFGYISQVVRGGSPRPAGDPTLFNGDYSPWVTVAEITKDDEIYLTETETFLTKKGSEQCRVFSAGTLLLSNSGATLGVPSILKIDANANDGVVGFENLELNHEFTYFYLSSLTDDLRERIKQGSGQPNLNTDLVKDISVPIPPKDEVESIVTSIHKTREHYKKLEAKAVSGIKLLQERRTTLISAAVTGKIDVRSWQAPEANQSN